MSRAALVLLLLSGCLDLSIAADDYDRACAADTDCAVVFEGDVCAVCTCANAAVRASESSRYAADAGRMKSWCGPRPAIACGPCQQASPACVAQRCDVRLVP